MSLENSIRREKIHGFGAFQQSAEFILFESRQLLDRGQCPDREEEKEFLDEMRVMFGLFECKYSLNGELPDALAHEKEAWQLLRIGIHQWIDAFTALIESGGDTLDRRRALIPECARLMKQWGVISSSFKRKLESLPSDDKDIREMIEKVRADISNSSLEKRELHMVQPPRVTSSAPQSP